jgi:hypothetical protein
MKIKKPSKLKMFLAAGALVLGISGKAHSGFVQDGYENITTGELVQKLPDSTSHLTRKEIQGDYSKYLKLVKGNSYLMQNGDTFYRYTIEDMYGNQLINVGGMPDGYDTTEKLISKMNGLNGNNLYISALDNTILFHNQIKDEENQIMQDNFIPHERFEYSGSNYDSNLVFMHSIFKDKDAKNFEDKYFSYDEFKQNIKNLIGNQSVNNVRSFLKYTYNRLYKNYDKSIKLGTSQEITLDEMYKENIVKGNDKGNCGHDTCTILDIAKDVFDIGGIVIHSGIHMSPIFEMEDGLYNPEINGVHKNLFKLIDKQIFPSVSSLFSTCSDALIGELQTLFQKNLETNLSPFGKKHYLDYFNKDNIDTTEAYGLKIFVLGDDKLITTVKYDLESKKYGNEFISGTFDAAFSLSQQDSSDYLNLNFVNGNFNNNISHKLDDKGKFILGNFTRGLLSYDLEGSIGAGNDRDKTVGHDISLRNTTYFLYNTLDGLHIGLGISQVFQTATVAQNQSVVGYNAKEITVGYNFNGVKLDYFFKTLGVTNTQTIKVNSKFKQLILDAEVSKTSSDNKFLQKYASEIQASIKATFKPMKNLEVGVSTSIEGSKTTNINLSYKF